MPHHEKQNTGGLARLRRRPLGLHRMYLYGIGDVWAWLYPIPTALGLYGIERRACSGSTTRPAGC